MELDRLLQWMEPTVDSGFVPPPFDPAVASAVLSAAGRSEQPHTQLLQRWNGFYAMNGLLHVLGACAAPPNHSLSVWNAPDGWRASWGRLTEGLTFFAESAFGDLFAYRGGKVVRFKAFEGGIDAQQAGIVEWLEACLLDPDFMLNKRTYDALAEALGPAPQGGHFAPVAPVSFIRELVPGNVRVVPARDSLEMKSVLASRVMSKRSSQLRLPPRG